jgi:hypothetical protein
MSSTYRLRRAARGPLSAVTAATSAQHLPLPALLTRYVSLFES